MNEATRQRLFGYEQAFDHPVTRQILIAVAVVLALAPLIFLTLRAAGMVSAKLNGELWKRYLSWLVLIPLMVAPVLLGAAWTIVCVGLLSVLCYREFTQAPGVPRDRLIEGIVYLGIVLLTLASLDNFYAFFTALFAEVICLIAAAAILADKPQGYLQRCAIGMFGYMLFGVALAHLGYLANDRLFRPLLLLLLLAVELNDVFAFCAGKLLGRRKLAPRTSPNKTIAGCLGAMVGTTLVVYLFAMQVFAGTPLAHSAHLVALGVMISVVGQLGDLMLSSVKRDLAIKDMAQLIPGHGGLLDRFDSLILVGPAVFHYVNYFYGVGLNEPTRVFSLG